MRKAPGVGIVAAVSGATWSDTVLVLGQTEPLDAIDLGFDPGTVLVLNVIVAVVMLGVALGIDVGELRRTLREPRGPLIGMCSQFVFLPAITFGLTLVADLPPSVALGALLVACCPAGAVSNLFTHLAGGNTSLSIGMTGLSTLVAVVATPFNLTFWASRHPDGAELLRSVAVDPVELGMALFVLLGVPVAVGLSIRVRAPAVADRLVRPAKVVGVIAIVVFIVAILADDWRAFREHLGLLVVAASLPGMLASAVGYLATSIAGLPEVDRRAVSIETGTQNAVLALGLTYVFYDGLGGMALVAAWWGLWQLVAGLVLAGFWSRRPAVLAEPAGA